MKKLKNIYVIGLGMMGTSLCKSIKKHNLDYNVSAYDLNHNSIKYCLKSKIIDFAIDDFSEIIRPDIIILCTPLSAYEPIIKKIMPYINKNTLITDIGSSKGKTYLKAAGLIKKSGSNFISSHPMVGSEKSSFSNSKTDMYKDKVVFLIDNKNSSKTQYLKLKKFWKSIGAQTHNISHTVHDSLMSQTSHVAHLMAYIFIQALPQSILDDHLPLLLGGGIKEHVRLSKSDPTMWSDIFFNNSKNISESLDRIQKNIRNFKSLLDSSNYDKIHKLLEEIGQKTR